MRTTLRYTLVAALSSLCLVVAPAAFAAKGGGGAGGGGGGKPSSGGTSSMTLVLLDSTDGVPHWGQRIRFDVSTTATTEPHVSLSCSQGGTVVYTTQTGYYDSYPWPWTQTMTLSSGAWTGGDADCHAELYSLKNSGGSTTLATMDFHVFA